MVNPNMITKYYKESEIFANFEKFEVCRLHTSAACFNLDKKR